MRARGTLFEQATNRTLDLLKTAVAVKQELPTENTLCTQLEVSRTTVRKIVQHLASLGVVEVNGGNKTLKRRPKKDDYFTAASAHSGMTEFAEHFVLQKLSRRELPPGSAFSELELARESGCSTVTIREVLLRIGRFGLIEKRPRHQWQVVQFTESMIGELLEMREILELHGIRRLLEMPEDSPSFCEIEELLEEHRQFESGTRAASEFPELDDRVHKAFLAACRNRYVDSFSTMCSFMIYYQIRPQEMDAQRVARAVEEHTRIFHALLKRDGQAAAKALGSHVEGAREFLCTPYGPEHTPQPETGTR